MNKNKTTLFNIASTVVLQGLTFFSAPIFSGILGAENYGIASVYYTWVQISSTVLSLQAGGTVALARIHFPEDEQKQFQSSVLSLATLCYLCFSLIIMSAATLFAAKFGSDLPMILAILIQGWGMYCVTFANGKFTYEFRADKNFVLSVGIAVLTVGASLLLIYAFPAEINYWGRILGQAVVYFFAGLIIYIWMMRNGKVFYKSEYWKYTLPITLPTVFHSLANLVLGQSDRVMLQSMVDNSAAGVYSLSATFAAVLQTIWNALNNSWAPFYYEFTRQNQIEEMRRHMRNYIELFTVVAMGFILLTKEVFFVFADAEYWSGVDFIPMFAVGYYFVFLYSFPVNYEFYHKKTKTIAVGTMSAAAINIALNIVLIRLMGVIGAVVATAAAHCCQFLFHFYRARAIDPEDFPFRMRDFIPGFFMLIAVCGIYFLAKDYWLIRWGLGAALGVYMLAKIIRRREIF